MRQLWKYEVLRCEKLQGLQLEVRSQSKNCRLRIQKYTRADATITFSRTNCKQQRTFESN
jgi:hypothetical protein